MAKEINFLKVGNLYVSSPIETSGDMTIQLGFLANGAWVKVETSISDEGWSLYSVDNAPKMPYLYSKRITAQAGVNVRITTNQMPKAALFIGGEQSDSASQGSTQTVASLSDITEPKAGVIYLVRNGEDGDNVYDEYIYTDGHFELLGGSSARMKTDISNVITEDAVTDEEIVQLFK